MLPPRTDNPGPGPADDGPSGDGAVSRSDITQAPEDIIAYWTPERMAEAKPREVRLPEPAGRTDAEADAGTGED
ncbi:hypothetical protein [Arthrobacter oryzae]|uniref:hypothetical protein n=1 Tax=Arthrobacter oryzae TaxID=409290 RepID=UPI00273C5A60|nr:hypothetical protein [Arthrobacter oryzae]WLQ05123.1 hypothetical protein Q8Z05_13310 [Arthrobacter oryzae]